MISILCSSGLNDSRRLVDPSRQSRSFIRSVAIRTICAMLSAGVGLASGTAAAGASGDGDRAQLAALDTQYQKAVKDNDAKTMAAILADDFVLVEGDGKRSTKADLLKSATDGKTHYQHQEDTERTIVVSGDTAVITAKLWAKGLEDGESVDYTEWFSDVYVRTPKGWRYFFAQASLPLPSTAKRRGADATLASRRWTMRHIAGAEPSVGRSARA